MERIGTGLGGKAHHAAARLAVLRFEAIRIDRELGESFNGRCIERRLVRVSGAVGAHAMTVKSGVPSGDLAASERKPLPAAARFGGYRDEVEGAAHGAADHQRKLIDKLV